MMPRLGHKYAIEMETISQPIAAYQTDEYFELDLPTAPAVMVGDDIVVEGADVAEAQLEAAIRRQLGLPPQTLEKTGFLKRLFGK